MVACDFTQKFQSFRKVKGCAGKSEGLNQKEVKEKNIDKIFNLSQ